jgi:4a-hydroxytetrahydrobiopterin dehydratase
MALRDLPDWRQRGARIERHWRFPSFRHATLFLTGTALAAESLNHHPEWSGSYDRVRIALTTHSAKALTELDFRLAAELEALAQQLGATGLEL